MRHIPVSAFTEAAVDSLLAEMARLSERDYPEIGVPMVLVTEDLTSAPGGRPLHDDGLSGLLARALSDCADMLRARKPDLAAEDLAGLIEVLADRCILGLEGPAFSRRADLHPSPLPDPASEPSRSAAQAA